MPDTDSDAGSAASWEQLRRRHVLPENHVIWKTYRDEASDLDEKFCKRWHETCDVLLVFAALFSAVLTAFLVESSKAFDQDYAKYTAVLLYTVLSHQEGASTFRFPPPGLLQSPMVYVASPISRAVNWLWYASLLLSLGACVMCLWAKQWLDNYEARVNAGFDSMQHWARRRALYHQGTSQWDLTGFIMALPLVMHVAVCLFFAGLALSLLPEDTGVTALVVALSLVLLAMYTLTAAVAVWKLESPWGTPLLRRMVNLIHRTWRPLHASMQAFEYAGPHWRITTAILRRVLDFSLSFLGDAESPTSREQSATQGMDPVILGWLMRNTLDEDVQFEALYMIGNILHAQSNTLAVRLDAYQTVWTSIETRHRESMSKFQVADAALQKHRSGPARSSSDRSVLTQKLRDASHAVREISGMRAYLKSVIRDTREEVLTLVRSLESGAVADLDQLAPPRNVAELICDPYVRRAALRLFTREVGNLDILGTLLSHPVDERRLRSLCTILYLAPFIRFDVETTAGHSGWSRVLEQLKTPISIVGQRSWVYDFIECMRSIPAANSGDLSAVQARFEAESTGSSGSDTLAEATRPLAFVSSISTGAEPSHPPSSQSAWEMLFTQQSSQSTSPGLFPIADLIVDELHSVGEEPRTVPAHVAAWRAAFCGGNWDMSRLLVSAFNTPATTIQPFMSKFMMIYEAERCSGTGNVLKDWDTLLKDALATSVNELFCLPFLGTIFAHLKPSGTTYIGLRTSEAEKMRLRALGAMRSVHALERAEDPPSMWESVHRFSPYVLAVIGLLPLEDDLSDDASPDVIASNLHESLAKLPPDSRIRNVDLTLDAIVPSWPGMLDQFYPRRVAIGLNDTAVLEKSTRPELRDFVRDTKLLVWDSVHDADAFATAWSSRPSYLQNVVIVWATV